MRTKRLRYPCVPAVRVRASTYVECGGETHRVVLTHSGRVVLEAHPNLRAEEAARRLACAEPRGCLRVLHDWRRNVAGAKLSRQVHAVLTPRRELGVLVRRRGARSRDPLAGDNYTHRLELLHRLFVEYLADTGALARLTHGGRRQVSAHAYLFPTGAPAVSCSPTAPGASSRQLVLNITQGWVTLYKHGLAAMAVPEYSQTDFVVQPHVARGGPLLAIRGRQLAPDVLVATVLDVPELTSTGVLRTYTLLLSRLPGGKNWRAVYYPDHEAVQNGVVLAPSR